MKNMRKVRKKNGYKKRYIRWLKKTSKNFETIKQFRDRIIEMDNLCFI